MVLLIASLLPALAVPTAQAGGSPFHELWRQGHAEGFVGWELANVGVVDGRLVFTPPAVGVAGRRSGTALSPERPTSEPFRDLIPSWNAETPTGTWLEARLRARIDGRWTRWYVLGVWTSDGAVEARHSVDGQDDADARVLTDTLALRTAGQAYQLELGLHSDHPDRSPGVSLAAVLASRTSGSAGVGGTERRAWGRTLDVPERSQMVYPEGGEVWCSPTSTSMVMAYWSVRLANPGLDIPVPQVAAGTYDSVYRGNGNWPFNTAYAARGGLLGYVSRFSSLEQVERWIELGVPIVASLAWGPGQLANAAIGSTDGHLLVIAGFSERGDVVVNDPAGDPRRGEAVRRVYDRGQFERLWLESSGGGVYLIYPGNHTIPSGARGAW
ncbi:MAG: peptidase C39 family protein [Chloroflexi bacterium]|nr:peptidase C39 family protein [Chloroflexota bacterium]